MVRKTNIFFIFFCLFLFVFFEFIGLDAIKGNIDFQFYSDTPTYHSIYQMNYGINELIIRNPNLVGPILVLKLVNANYYLVFIINLIVFYISLKNILKHYNLNNTKYLLLLLICPLMLGSLIGVNKEIFSILVCSYLLLFVKTKQLKHLLLAILFCVFVRWQLLFFVMTTAFYYSHFNPLKKKPFLYLILMIITISLIYPLVLSGNEIINSVNSNAEFGAENEIEGSGLYTQLIQIQNKPFGYALAFVPKALQIFGGLLFRWRNIFNTNDLYNNFFIFLQAVAYVIMLYKVIKNKVTLKNEIIFIGLIYIIIFSISPIYAPRYMFPIYMLLAIELSRDKSSKLKT